MKFKQYLLEQHDKAFRNLNKAFVSFFKELGSEYYQTPKDINKGYCAAWAWLAYNLIPGSQLATDTIFKHAFIKIGGKYYDAKTPKGVRDWRDIAGLRKQRPGLRQAAEKHNYQEAKADFDKTMDRGKWLSYWKSNPAIGGMRKAEDIQQYI